jgi:hypothetical protein
MTPLQWSDEGRIPLFAAYAKAQAGMGEVFKNATNPAFKTKYANLAAVVEAVMPSMNDNGLAVIQSPSFDGEILNIETYIVHQEGGWIKSILEVRPAKTDAQGIGSAITYLRRYALMSIAGVAPEDDDGNAASSNGNGGTHTERCAPQHKPSEAARLAIQLLQSSKSADDFKATWAANKEGWKGVLADEDYAYVVRSMKAQAEVWQARTGRDPQVPTPTPTPADATDQADPFTELAGDKIPF